jgi:hypothetical protein
MAAAASSPLSTAAATGPSRWRPKRAKLWSGLHHTLEFSKANFYSLHATTNQQTLRL